MAVGFLLPILFGHPSAFSSMSMWSAFALWAALAWERTPRALQIVGLGSLVLAGAAIGIVGFFAPEISGRIASTGTNWHALRRLLVIAGLALGIFNGLALYFAARRRSEIALLLVQVAMVPVGLCLTEGVSRMAPSFSLASAARFLNLRLENRGLVLYEGPPSHASSLTFYLDQKFFLVNQNPGPFDRSAAAKEKYLDENFVLEAWTHFDPIYLIIDEDRVPYWQELVVARAHIFHQVTSCGHYAVLSNQL